MGWGFSIPGTNVYVGEEGATSRESGTDIGSAQYLNPMTWLPAAGAEVNNSYDRQKELEDAEKRAGAASASSRANLAALRDLASRLSKDYQAKLPEYQKGLVDIAMKTNRQQLAAKMKTQNQDLSNRGLISGGVAQGKASESSNIARSDLADKENQISKDVYDQGQQFNTDVSNIGLQIAGMDVDSQNDYFKNAMTNMQNRTNAYGQAGGSLGGLLGSYAAFQKKKPTMAADPGGESKLVPA